MKIKWWGHAAFLITSTKGTKIITDPYNDEVGYKMIDDLADIVTVSHNHFDHGAADLLPGDPMVIDEEGRFSVKDVLIRGVECFHDEFEGKKRGKNLVFIITVDGIKVCHMGDIGHIPDNNLIDNIGDIDILLLPVGGHYTIDAVQAKRVCNQLSPSVVIPMHYKTDAINFPIKGVQEFAGLFDEDKVIRHKGAEIVIESLPKDQMVYLLDYVR